MFDNIGGKIKGLATIICYLGIAASVISGFILVIEGLDSYYGEANVITGVLVIILGSLGSWIGSFFTYGFGELIEKATEIEYNTRKNKESANQTRSYSPAAPQVKVDSKLEEIITGKKAADKNFNVTCPHCGALVKGSPCEMCGKAF